MRRSLSLVAIALLVGCAPPQPSLPPGPSGLQRIAVDEPVNRTGGALVLEEPGAFERLIGEKRATVPGILAEDLAARFEYQGFRLGTGKVDDVPVFRTEIRRWQPFTADYSTVTVDIAASLVEPGSGRTLWSATRSEWNVRTTDAHSRAEAFRIASAGIAEELLAGWRPGP